MIVYLVIKNGFVLKGFIVERNARNWVDAHGEDQNLVIQPVTVDDAQSFPDHA